MLDSLSDLVVFGVVPALCLYIWALQDAGTIAWWATLFYAVSIALRLARFDSELTNSPEYAKNYFTGIPAPASGFLVLLPIVIDLQFNLEIVKDEKWVSTWLVVVGAGAVSTLPTFAGKRMKLPVASVPRILAAIGLLGAAVVTEPWLTYITAMLAYGLVLALSTLQFIKERRHYEKDAG